MKISKIELFMVAVQGLIYLASIILDLHSIAFIVGFIFGVWLITRGSEIAVDGLKSISIYLGLSEYIAGVISSLASNLPELALSSIMIFEGLAQGSEALIEIAILSVIAASGFNILLLGLLIILLSWRKGAIRIPYSAIAHESDLIRMTIVVCLLIFVLGIIEGGKGFLPKEIGFFLILIYAAYMVFILRGEQEKLESSSLELSRKKAVILLVLGFISIFIGGEILTESAEFILHKFNLSLITVAILLGSLGSIPEHGIAIIGAKKGLVKLGLANLLAGISQCILIVLGFIALIIPVPLDGYVMFQLVSVAASLWMVKKTILDDEKLTLDEGIFILILQILLFIMLEELRF
ncbi:MAG: hypothetical protein NDF54_00905 [archaeon GB-1867-035]|nr:hypothetical protein [Candidatus Culexmicrobium profundum]